ncbi:MAG: hypothetical protein GWP08_18675, partial [Nitrospiraceae bacterium]|nr:hypothetical protein [Nitrospiraceae bacterium]
MTSHAFSQPPDGFSTGAKVDGPDGWRVWFDPAPSRLHCVHEASGATIAGELSFAVEEGGATHPWLIILPRDRVSTRLGLLDGKGNVQGYVAFGGSGDTLRIAVVHRPEQTYRGTLTFRTTARLGRETFACRTRPLAGSRVVQMASGLATSGLNGSLFDIATDTALRFTARDVAIATRDEAGGAPEFDVAMTALVHEPGDSALVFEVLRDYYRSPYVPYYQPINKQRCPSAPTGWLSWNSYFDTAGEEGNLAEMRVAAEHLKPFGLEFWSIESWQPNSDKLPVSKFHTQTLEAHPKQFPRGMKWMAERIREFGFRPGIWTVPFGTGDKAFYEAHKDWFLHDPDGNPMHNWSGLYVLDPSQEVVRRHIEENHRVISEEWGYEYWKIDGVSARDDHKAAHFFERPEVRAAFKEPCDDPLRLCLEALRRGIGPDSIWVGCGGHYTGPDVEFMDTARLGADIVSGCYRKPPPKWRNYLSQARMTLNQLFVHNIIWYNDPDTLMVEAATPLNVARLAATVVALPGQVTFAGDKLTELPAERMRLLQQALPVCDVRPLD